MSTAFGEPRDQLSKKSDSYPNTSGSLRGGPVTLRFDRRTFIIWWGSDASGVDRLESSGDRVRTWATIEECLHETITEAASPGRPPTKTPGNEWLLDFEAAQDWLGGRRIALDYRSALDLWNLAGDVTVTLELPRFDRGRVADDCYSKLLAACVPWTFDRMQYKPRWTTREYRRLRQVLGESVRLLRGAL